MSRIRDNWTIASLIFILGILLSAILCVSLRHSADSIQRVRRHSVTTTNTTQKKQHTSKHTPSSSKKTKASSAYYIRMGILILTPCTIALYLLGNLSGLILYTSIGVLGACRFIFISIANRVGLSSYIFGKNCMVYTVYCILYCIVFVAL